MQLSATRFLPVRVPAVSVSPRMTSSPLPETADAIAIETPPSARAPRASRTSLQWLLALLGATLLAALIYRAGPQRLAHHLLALGWWAPLIFVPYALASAFDAAGWAATFGPLRPPFWLLYVARIIGEAVNNVTPTAYLGGEPVKAYVLHRFGIPLADGTTSVILAKTALTVAQIAFVILGVALLFLQRGPTASTIPTLVAMVLAGTAITAALVWWQRRGLVASVVAAVRRVFPRARVVERLHGRAADVDARLRAFYGARRGAAIASVSLHLLGWIAGGAEVYVIMTLLGHPLGWTEAIIIEALAQPTRLLGIVVPGTVGVQEAGGMLIFGLLGLAPELGLALMLLKRVREIGYSLLGLALLPRLRPQASVVAA
jgi:glycosyltransferase 2 family protein